MSLFFSWNWEFVYIICLQLPDEDDDDIDGIPLDSFDSKIDESARQRLRDVEVKVMCYQDELESGREHIRPGWTISQQVST